MSEHTRRIHLASFINSLDTISAEKWFCWVPWPGFIQIVFIIFSLKNAFVTKLSCDVCVCVHQQFNIRCDDGSRTSISVFRIDKHKSRRVTSCFVQFQILQGC